MSGVHFDSIEREKFKLSPSFRMSVLRRVWLQGEEIQGCLHIRVLPTARKSLSTSVRHLRSHSPANLCWMVNMKRWKDLEILSDLVMSTVTHALAEVGFSPAHARRACLATNVSSFPTQEKKICRSLLQDEWSSSATGMMTGFDLTNQSLRCTIWRALQRGLSRFQKTRPHQMLLH